MLVIRDDSDLRSAAPHGRGLGGVLVPTMGALHEGHAALIRHAADAARRGGGSCDVSIFVNPTQFNQPSDYTRYPRTLDSDLAVCAAAGATVVFAPTPETVYPPGRPVPVPRLPVVATTPGLEDAFRPGHFAGVCQVVKRLFDLLGPERAVFGEKDWQQLRVIASMVRDLAIPIEIMPHPTLRDPDGLAMSSRNRFLSPEERAAALAIPRALEAAARASTPDAAEAAMRSVLAGSGLRPEYAVVRDADTLTALRAEGATGRALIAAWSGSTRLIDNAPWPR